jgi:hypothetical protein
MPTGALVSHYITTTSATTTTAPAGTVLVPSPLFSPGNSNDASNDCKLLARKLGWLGVGIILALTLA